LAWPFGGGMGESLFGSRAGNVLTRMTVMLAVVFMVTTMGLGFLFANSNGNSGSVMQKAEAQAPLVPAAPAAQTAAPQTAPAPMMMDQSPMASEAVTMEVGEDGQLSTVDVVEEVAMPEAEAEAAPQE